MPLILILIHVLGDFYFQSDGMAERKSSRYGAVVKHSVIYAVIAALVCVPVFTTELLIAAAALAALHFAIDTVKYLCVFKTGRNEDEADTRTKVRIRFVYVADQWLHILSIAAIAFAFGCPGVTPAPFFNALLQPMTVSPSGCFRWAVWLLLVWKPVNITIKYLLLPYRPDDVADDGGNKLLKAGAFIGGLERTIMLGLLAVQQYAAIGLVLTAKSIARYSRIQEDKQFAEYYLLGTLLSAIGALCVFFIIN